MEREEAIKVLDEMFNTYDELHENTDGDLGHEQMQALQVAIEALSNYTTKKPNDAVEQKNDVVAEPTDLISRADVLALAEKGYIISNSNYKKVCDLINELPSADTQTSGDFISRADAIALLTKIVFDEPPYLDSETLCRLYAEEQINALPSADRPSGEWIIRDNGNKECSLCGHERQDGWDYFCGYCGAKMGSDGLCVEWKPVSKELPQSVGSYIVTCKDEQGRVYVDYDYWTVADRFKYNCSKVTAWIPFPKPYCGTKIGSD